MGGAGETTARRVGKPGRHLSLTAGGGTRGKERAHRAARAPVLRRPIGQQQQTVVRRRAGDEGPEAFRAVRIKKHPSEAPTENGRHHRARAPHGAHLKPRPTPLWPCPRALDWSGCGELKRRWSASRPSILKRSRGQQASKDAGRRLTSTNVRHGLRLREPERECICNFFQTIASRETRVLSVASTMAPADPNVRARSMGSLSVWFFYSINEKRRPVRPCRCLDQWKRGTVLADHPPTRRGCREALHHAPPN